MADPSDKTCPPDVIARTTDAIRSDTTQGLAAIEAALERYPGDARLHFLRGSVLAGLHRYDDARAAMRETLRLAPGFAVARFQLGFLELTSGEPAAAEAAWAPLEALAGDNYLRIFASGLRALIRDEFAAAVAQLALGIERNAENPELSANMQLIIDKVRAEHLEPPAEEAVSEAHLLLQRYPKAPTRH